MDGKAMSEAQLLAQRLIAREFGPFFEYPQHDRTVDAVWADPKNHSLLAEIARTATMPAEARFLACEVLFRKDILFLQGQDRKQIAAVYAQALVHNYTGAANSWGLLYEHGDEGPVGIVFLQLGENAVDALVPLLDDAGQRLSYVGSIEATVGNAYQYRIKDFAAYYLARIKGIPIAFHRDFAERDAEIERLRQRLGR